MKKLEWHEVAGLNEHAHSTMLDPSDVFRSGWTSLQGRVECEERLWLCVLGKLCMYSSRHQRCPNIDLDYSKRNIGQIRELSRSYLLLRLVLYSQHLLTTSSIPHILLGERGCRSTESVRLTFLIRLELRTLHVVRSSMPITLSGHHYPSCTYFNLWDFRNNRR